MYLWINYFLFEELDAKDYDRAREVMRELFKVSPTQGVFVFESVDHGGEV